MNAKMPVVSAKFGTISVYEQSGPGGVGSAPRPDAHHGRMNAMGTIRIPLHSRKYPHLYALIDEEDADLVNQHRWNVANADRVVSYAKTYIPKDGKKPGRWILLHRLILGLHESSMQVDHINGNGLDNRRCNLRSCNMRQNQANRHKMRSSSSPYRGVTWHKGLQKWQVQVSGVYIGCFDSEIDAALIYDRVAVREFGEFARPNFPKKEGSQ